MMLRTTLLVFILAGCSKSKSEEGQGSATAPPAQGSAAAAQGSAAPAQGSAAPAPGSTVPGAPSAPVGDNVPKRPPCPEPVTLDCDRLVPKQVRDTFLAGKTLALDNGRCIVGPPGFEVTVSVAKADKALVDSLLASADKVERLGRAAASYPGDKITFLASALDCAISVHVPNKLAAGTDLGRAIDSHFTAETVSTSPAP